jgi:chromosome partitioning protein
MAEVIAVAVPKGGSGKTTTALNLGAALAERGSRVLCVDMDPQGNLTEALGIADKDITHTVYTAIHSFLQTYEPRLDLVICPTSAGFDLAPTDVRLTLAEAELTVAPTGPTIMQMLLAPLLNRYDVILLDTLPSLGVLVRNALVAAQSVIIPMQAEPLSAQSVSLMLDQIQFMRRSRLNPTLRVLGILFTMVDSRTNISRDVIEYAREAFGSQVPLFATTIPRSTRVPESQARYETILQYEQSGKVASAYRALAEEVFGATA